MAMNASFPGNQGLYSSDFEHDSCGVGFVANIKGSKSHEIVRNGIEVLENLKHRGATGSDPDTGDGAGILIQIPDKFFRKVCPLIDIELPEKGDYGVGLIFLPTLVEDRHTIENIIEHAVHEEGQKFLGFRDVPHNENTIGRVARSVMPEFKQMFVGRGNSTSPEDFERKLLVIRKKLGLKVRVRELSQKHYFYMCSLSSKVLIYKGQLKAEQLDKFFPDLRDENLESAISLVHSRYSTNTFPTWALAHPFRMIAHNGEINTLRGNLNWFNVREKLFASDIFGEDLEKIYPVIAPSKSDSAAFDNALEMLVYSGRSLPHAVMMMIPEAYTGDKNMEEYKKSFYEYHACLMEPWDGPAAISFTDGRYIGSVLDRNGLRPSRYTITEDDVVILASETGALNIPEEKIVKKGRLQPGKIFLVDTFEGRIIDDEEIKKSVAESKPYKLWLKDNLLHLDDLQETTEEVVVENILLLQKQKIFGYTIEDIKIIIQPMLELGVEATGSMGADTPLAVLSKKPQLLFNYFKQLFAQVTNPPIDAIREKIIMCEQVFLGSEQNLLVETPSHCRRLKLESPIIKNSDLVKIKRLDKDKLKTKTLSMLFNKGEKIADSLDSIFVAADKAISDGNTIIVLSDRYVDKEYAPVPSLLACSGLHHHLIRKGTRTKVSIIIETGEAREMHHFAVLIGYGANAINPYLVFETIEDLVNRNQLSENLDYRTAEKNYLKAITKGLYKIISKMGISTIQSYCGAQIFEAIGINEEVIDKYFTSTYSPIGGVGLNVICKEVQMRHESAFADEYQVSEMLDEGGFYAWRKGSEYHQWNPSTIALLQHAVRSGDYNLYKKYALQVNDPIENYATIRSLLQFKERKTVPIEEVEPASEIAKRFATGAMSYGSISKEAHESLAIAMNELGGFSNTGEGGEDPERFVLDPDGKSRRSRIKQVAQGRFGVTIEYLVNADQIQIKMAQGAKPGEGGQLPGYKVSKEIAKTRYTTPGVGLISPPPHHDIYSIEDLAQLIHDLKKSNPSADISVKLVSEAGVGTIAAGVSKGKADHLVISGYEGGTGASPQTSIKHAGLPMELGIAETQQVLVMNDLRRRIRVQVDGQLKTGRDVVIAGMLGADEFGFATSALISMGCVMLRKCHLNTCSVGVATQDPELRKLFKGKPEHVINFFTFIAEDVREIMAKMGIRKFNDLIGKSDMLEQVDTVDHWKAKYLDLTNILHRPDVPVKVPIYNMEKQIHKTHKWVDTSLIEACNKGITKKTPVRFARLINNTDRTVGTTLSGKIAKLYGLNGLPEDTIQIDFEGTAGQSFGAFLAKGITFYLEGDANDYVGKGLSGGKIVIVPMEKSKIIPEQNIIVGNVVLYGAISGEMYIRGQAGERFAVRNSGAVAVVEGVGDHGCEYMTGGRVVVLGKTGRNFAAGMSGGIAYVWDNDKTFAKTYNPEMVDLVNVEVKDQSELLTLIKNHHNYTRSTLAKYVLDNWKDQRSKFIKVFPKDYKRVLDEMGTDENSRSLIETNELIKE
ncbi:MAG: glutamate synthase large subunit [Ignavibacteriae bacterium HGW-Ignavibacteriae-2]|nr:MAG: glutamate synthase large subunit [Ignavibacteriae bacterium HGW-Ignavibacteriae-2]